MSARILFICIILFNSIVSFSQNKKAFMVGISHYDNALTGYEWNDIHGKEDVQLISKHLIKQGFSITSVIDNKATYKNILNSYSIFLSKVCQGDIVYIHFSTHGQPFEDKNGDESDGWDESIVPVDARKKFQKGIYEGKSHLLDDKLNIMISKLRTKIGQHGFLYVIIDACHAGTSSRGDENEIIRGTSIGFSSNPSISYNPPLNKTTNYKTDSSKKQCSVLFIEACRADQTNREVKIDGHYYGALSFNVAEALKTIYLSKEPTILLNAIRNSMRQHGHWPNNQNIVTESSF